MPADEIQELLDGDSHFEKDMERIVCLLHRIASRLIEITLTEITLDDLCGNPVLYLDVNMYRDEDNQLAQESNQELASLKKSKKDRTGKKKLRKRRKIIQTRNQPWVNSTDHPAN